MLAIISVLTRCILAVAAILLLFNVGCAYRQSEAIRTGSFKPYAGRHIGQDEVGAFLSSRVAFLVGSDHFPTNKWLAGEPKLPGLANYGCAAAIDSRGYFLTAAHCLDQSPVYLILYDFGTNGTTIRALHARVVWQGSWRKGGPDLALLHVHRTLAHTFDLAEELRKDDPVMAVGLSLGNRLKWELRGFELMGGKVLNYSQRKGEAGGLKVATDLPLQSGDSGGPLVDSGGHLLGINSKGTPPFVHRILPKSRFPTLSERPNPKWVSERIEKDVAARLAASAGTRD